MKRDEVIERLKNGEEIIFDTGFFCSAFFRGDMKTVRYDTALKLIKDGLIDRRRSETAHGLSYLTWKELATTNKEGV